MKFKQILLAVVLPLSLVHCTQKPDFEKEKQQLLQLHQAQQTAHLQKNAEQFVRQFADKMLLVNRGKITTSDRASALQKFQHYFDAVEFKRWEDLSPPQITFSDDASLAYIVVDKSVVLTTRNDKNELLEESTHFAWVSICRKQADGSWKIVCNVSTNEPPREQLVENR